MKRFFASLSALCLLWTLLPPAAARSGPALTWRESGDGVLLILEGVEEELYALQAELVLDGEYPNAAFTPALSEVYSPNCRAEVRRGGTTVTLYIVAEERFPDRTLRLGTLTPGEGFTVSALPARANLTLLDRDLRPLEDSGRVSLSENSGEGGHRVRVADSAHGSVAASADSALPGETVLLTAAPEAGYGLERLTVTDSRSRSVELKEEGTNRRSFVMPDFDVEVNAVFSTGGSEALPFLDVAPGAWCYDAVRDVYARGLMNGTTGTTFNPNGATTRGMIVAILYRQEGSPTAGLSSFSDVSPNAYYASAVAWANANGIVNGYGDGTFRPGSPITREQMAAFLFRYAHYKGRDVSARADLSPFTDAEQIAGYAVEPLRWANAAGLINGTGPTTLSPKGTTTRAQAAVILSRCIQNVLS